MEWVEITAKTVEEAKDRALDELGIGEAEAEFVVLEEPRRGLFGQSRGTARVRARVTPRTPRAKTERRGRRSRSTGGGDSAGSDTAGTRSSKKGSRTESSRAKNTSKNGKSSDRKPTPSKATPSSDQNENATSSKEEGIPMTMTLDEQVAATESFLGGLLEAIGFEARIETERTDDSNAQVDIVGDDLGLLIGPRGQTMNAIQDLARVTLQKQAAGSWEGHVHVDVNGYRAKRRAALVAFVEKVAADVRASGRAKALEPMASADRKVVHDTVNGLDGVTTSSEGQEPRRWVKISPEQG